MRKLLFVLLAFCGLACTDPFDTHVTGTEIITCQFPMYMKWTVPVQAEFSVYAPGDNTLSYNNEYGDHLVYDFISTTFATLRPVVYGSRSYVSGKVNWGFEGSAAGNAEIYFNTPQPGGNVCFHAQVEHWVVQNQW